MAIPQQVWLSGPKVVNAEIRRLIEERTVRPRLAEDVEESPREIDLDDAVYILEDLPNPPQADLSAYGRIAPARRLDYPEGSAGRRMQTEFIAVPPSWTVGQSIDYVGNTDDLPERFFEVYVIDAVGKLLGALPLDRLVRTKRRTLISELTEPERHAVRADADQHHVARQFERYNLVAAPVVDVDGRIVGVITFDDVVDVIEQEAEEEIQALGAEPPPNIPAGRHAAIKPFWDGNVVTISKSAVLTDQGDAAFVSALGGLRTLLHNFAVEISGEANIDRRFVSFVRTLAERIPDEAPPQHELFELGHVEAVFAQYTRTVNEQWPSFLAARYHGVVLQFDRTMRQSGAWRDFKRSAQEARLTPAQTREAAEFANTAAAALRNDEAGEFVDPVVPQVLEHLLDPRSRWPEDALKEIDVGKEELAADLIESTNNILKAIAEVALPALKGIADAARRAGGKATTAFWAEFEKGIIAEAKVRGKPAGRAAVRWLLRLAIGAGGATGAVGAGYGVYATFTRLMTHYPEAFGWFERLLQFFNRVLPI